MEKRADVEVGSLYVSCANPRFYGSVIAYVEQLQVRRLLDGGLQYGGQRSTSAPGWRSERPLVLASHPALLAAPCYAQLSS